GNYYLDWKNARYYDFYDWKSQFFVDFLENVVKTSNEYELAALAICNVYKIPEDAKHIGINDFVTYLMHHIPNNAVNEDTITEVITLFINDYEIGRGDKLYTWKITVWLSKLDFEGDSILISDNVILRKPQSNELILRRPVKTYEDESEKFYGKGIRELSVLEFSMKAPVQHMGLYSDLIREEMEKWINIFRLFKVGNVYPIFRTVYPNSIMHNGTTESPPLPFDEGWEYKIDNRDKGSYLCYIRENEKPLLVKFASQLKPMLETISLKTYLNGPPLNIAFHRYNDALLKSNIHVDRIVSAIGSLEALLSDPSGEISYRISIYVAGILRFWGYNSLKVYEKVRDAYKVRSQLVHGNKLSEELLEFTRKHAHEIVNYVRLCLLISMQLNDKIGKKEFIKKLNYSLIDNTTYNELGKLIKENVFIPVVYPFLKELNPDGDEIS
ncbi:MAG TPA: hypothetical protein VNZ45_06695, partial [Bacteroidia bacterium]|nr:hypothetical protein [Bacteroidia bacterium]